MHPSAATALPGRELQMPASALRCAHGRAARTGPHEARGVLRRGAGGNAGTRSRAEVSRPRLAPEGRLGGGGAREDPRDARARPDDRRAAARRRHSRGAAARAEDVVRNARLRQGRKGALLLPGGEQVQDALRHLRVQRPRGARRRQHLADGVRVARADTGGRGANRRAGGARGRVTATDEGQQAGTVDVVERFLAAFDHRWPTPEELDGLLSPEVTMTERPNLLKPAGGTRNAAGVRAGVEAGKALLAWQSYEPRDHVAEADTVVTRMRWTGELAVDAGPWPAGTRLAAWCVAHYRLR